MLGDRIPYLVVVGKTWRGGQTRQGVTERAEDIDYIIKNGLKIDKNYYVEKQLLKPLVRLLRPFGVSAVDLDPKGQKFLLEF
jgi:DNA polymerase elongation subunit (family B)